MVEFVPFAAVVVVGVVETFAAEVFVPFAAVVVGL
jgi:hypothetical protein